MAIPHGRKLHAGALRCLQRGAYHRGTFLAREQILGAARLKRGTQHNDHARRALQRLAQQRCVAIVEWLKASDQHCRLKYLAHEAIPPDNLLRIQPEFAQYSICALIGIWRPLPNARARTRRIGGACRRLYSARAIMRLMRAISAAPSAVALRAA